VESLHLTGPLPAIRRLAELAARLRVQHEVTGGVLRVAFEDAGPLIDGAHTALAPLESGLVRAVRTDLSRDSLSLLAVSASSPSIANLAARRKHRRLLQVIQSREGVTVGFQPVLQLATSTVVGYESLLRVRIGTMDVSPADVLAAAEDCGRLVEVDAAARSEALREAAPTIGSRLLMINLLPASLPVPDEQLAPFVAEVRTLGVEPSRLVLEAPVGPAGVLRRQLESVFRAARAAGFLLALDNVRSQRDLDAVDVVPDFVKLDRSMVRGLPSSAATRAVSQVVKECSYSGARIVAQGVESAEQVDIVRDLGIEMAQGWFLGRPGALPAEVDAGCA
jgi:EAL domain-containing protein (putative c-di-GMP-specific phosphodiesterase class I)